MSESWNTFFMDMAKLAASKSKDPSTKCGAVIADRGNRLVSLGFNGFAAGVDDRPERYADRGVKYGMVLHAEENALLFAKRDLSGCRLYVWPMPPCSLCAARIIQSGITEVYSIEPTNEQKERWDTSFAWAQQQFAEAGVQLILLKQGDSV